MFRRLGLTALLAGVAVAAIAATVLWLRLAPFGGGLSRTDLELAVTAGSVAAIAVLGLELALPRVFSRWRARAEPRGIRFDQFSDGARAAIALSQDEARRLNHNYIGTEHLLLGMLRQGGVGASILTEAGVGLDQLRRAADEYVGRGDRPIVGEVGLSVRARAGIELAYHEAERMKRDVVGTGHLLLGVLLAQDAVATQLLESLRVDLPALVKRATEQAPEEDVKPEPRITSGSPYEATIGFSRALRVGRAVFISGTAPIWPDGSCDADPEVQAARCFEIVLAALAEAGGEPRHVVRTRLYITDAAFAEPVGRAHHAVFDEVRPAATMVVVAGLLDPRWKVEVEAEALIR